MVRSIVPSAAEGTELGRDCRASRESAQDLDFLPELRDDYLVHNGLEIRGLAVAESVANPGVVEPEGLDELPGALDSDLTLRPGACVVVRRQPSVTI